MKKAYTLSEVLITLSIIGVVAAVTLPALINKVQEQQFKNARNKILSSFDNAARLIAAEGNISSATNSENFVKDILSKKIKVIKTCNTSPSQCGFSSKITRLDDKTTISIPINIGSLGLTNWFSTSATTRTSYAFVTADGYSINLYYNPNCKVLSKTEATRTASDSICINLVYDMNGNKKPNKVGKDIGWVSVINNDESVITVAPLFVETNIFNTATVAEAKNLCQQKNLALPNLQELLSGLYNRSLINNLHTHDSPMWTSSSVSGTNSKNWAINPYRGITYRYESSSRIIFRCVKR